VVFTWTLGPHGAGSVTDPLKNKLILRGGCFMKKLIALVLTTSLVLGLTTGAMAAAPGQAVNFSKGVTTVVTTNKEVNTVIETGTIIHDPVSVNSVPQSSVSTDVTHGTSVVTIEKHPVQDWTREVTTVPVTTVTTTTSWNDVTYETITDRTETPVTTTITTTTTILHQGAPGSNGKLISSDSVVTTEVTRGQTVVVSSEVTNTETVKENVESTSVTTNSTIVTYGEWIKVEGTPSTEPQGDNGNGGGSENGGGSNHGGGHR
jgi:hypothetical protein